MLLLSLLPGPFQNLARRGRAGLLAVVVVHALLVLAAGLLVLRLVSGQWLPSYAGVTVLALGVASQFACRAVNGRTSP